MQTTQVEPTTPARPALLDAQGGARAREWMRSDAAALAAMFVAIAVYYMLPGLPAAVAGGALFLAVAFWKPYLTPVPIAAGMSLFYRPREIGHLSFPLDEFLILAAVGVWVVRDGLALWRQPGGLASLP